MRILDVSDKRERCHKLHATTKGNCYTLEPPNEVEDLKSANPSPTGILNGLEENHLPLKSTSCSTRSGNIKNHFDVRGEKRLFQNDEIGEEQSSEGNISVPECNDGNDDKCPARKRRKDFEENISKVVGSCIGKTTFPSIQDSSKTENIQAMLQENQLWQQFNKLHTEMIITKAGRYLTNSSCRH